MCRPTRMQLLVDAGVNRLSLGVQSFDADKLRRSGTGSSGGRHLPCRRGRAPVPAEPGRRLDLRRAGRDAGRLATGPDGNAATGAASRLHLRLDVRTRRALLEPACQGQLQPIAEEDERWMYETAIEQLTAAGWEHYEVSNFARPGHRCRHNEVYWTGGEYYAAGPGAARHLQGRRETNHRSTFTYLQRVLAGQSPVAESEQLDPEDRARERLVFGLRRLEGVDLGRFEQETGFAVERLLGASLVRYQQLGLLTVQASHLKLTRSGLLISDALWPEVLRV